MLDITVVKITYINQTHDYKFFRRIANAQKYADYFNANEYSSQYAEVLTGRAAQAGYNFYSYNGKFLGDYND